MEMFYDFIGRLFFPRQQDWERRRTARIMTFVVLFSLALALIIAKVIHLMYNHTR